jgi:hypothetical protein
LGSNNFSEPEPRGQYKIITDRFIKAKHIIHPEIDSLGLSSYIRKVGSRLRRDNWVSVRYAEELNSSKSSVLLQRADRHGILGEKPPDFQVSL